MSTYRPGETASILGVASATLRRYSVQFAAHLSPSASAAVAQGGGALERRYSESDIALLKRASGMLERGLTFDQVRAQLGQPEQSAPAHELSITPDAGRALVELVSARGETIAAQRETIALLHSELERLRKMQPQEKIALLQTEAERFHKMQTLMQESDQDYSDVMELYEKQVAGLQSEVERLRAELERQQQRYMGIIRKLVERTK